MLERKRKVSTFELGDGTRFDVHGELKFTDLGSIAGPAPVLKHRPELGADVWTPLGPDETLSDVDEIVTAGTKAPVDMLVGRRELPGSYKLVRAGERIP